MIALDLQTFQQSRPNGNVTGVIYLELESGEFPERGWSDFPVIILGWWTEAFLQLEADNRGEVQWRFMDGPYTATLAGIQSGGPASAFDYAEPRKSLLDAAERAVSHCEQLKMFSRDWETLRENIQRLKANKTVQRTGAGRFAQIEIRTSVAAGSRR
jgi:hypothetical protein